MSTSSLLVALLRIPDAEPFFRIKPLGSVMGARDSQICVPAKESKLELRATDFEVVCAAVTFIVNVVSLYPSCFNTIVYGDKSKLFRVSGVTFPEFTGVPVVPLTYQI